VNVFSVGHPRISAYCWAWGDWNAIVTETFDMLPIMGPVASDAPATFTVFGKNYGTNESALLPATFLYTIDPDLHNNNPGTIVTSQTAPANQNPDIGMTIQATLPGLNPVGTHKQMFRYMRPAADGIRELDSLLVWSQAVSSSTPPPPPPPPPDRCAGLVGQSGVVAVGGVPFLVTVTSTTCAATAVVQ
jgi:hypothetical protein